MNNRHLVCPAMVDADITDAESQAGKDFCMEQCPYPKCIVMEHRTRELNVFMAKEFLKQGLTIDYISKQLGKTTTTILEYLDS